MRHLVILVLIATAAGPARAAAQRSPTLGRGCVSGGSIGIGACPDSAPRPGLRLSGLESEGSAFRWALLGTVVPVAAGAAIIALDRPKLTTFQGPNGEVYGGNYREPDRTLPALLIMTGVLFGPSLGYLNSDRAGHGWAMFVLRTGVLFGSSFAAMGICGWDCSPGSGDAVAGAVIGLAGLGFTLGSAIHDIATVKRSVRETNRARQRVSAAVLPTYIAATGAPGVAVQVTF